jgi:hypothetical protein
MEFQATGELLSIANSLTHMCPTGGAQENFDIAKDIDFIGQEIEIDKIDSVEMENSLTNPVLLAQSGCKSERNESRGPTRMIRSFLEELYKSWQMAVNACQFQPDFEQNLIACHLDNASSLSKFLLKTQLTSVAKILVLFSRQQEEFIAIDQSDQRRLILRNAPTFVQYILSRYFLSETGAEQVRQLIFKLPKLRHPENLKHVKLHDFMQMTNLCNMRRPGLTKKYGEQVALGIIFPDAPIEVIAMACLFRRRQEDLLQDKKLIAINEAKIRTALDWAHEACGTPSFNEMSALLEHSESLSVSFDQLVVWDRQFEVKTIDPLCKGLLLFQTIEGEEWKQRQIIKLSDTIYQIAPEETLVKDMVLLCSNHSLNAPDFMDRMIRVGLARSLASLKMHEAFSTLAIADQVQVFERNFLYYLATFAIRGTASKTVQEQLQFMLGNANMVDTLLHNACNVKQMIPYTMMKVNKAADFRVIPEEVCVQWDQAAFDGSRKSKFGQGNNLFQLFLLYLMTQTNGLEGNFAEMKSLNKEYLFQIWLECRRHGFDFETEFGFIINQTNHMRRLVAAWLESRLDFPRIVCPSN